MHVLMQHIVCNSWELLPAMHWINYETFDIAKICDYGRFQERLHAFTNWKKSDFPSFGLLLINLVCFFSSSSPSAIISHYNGFFFSLLILHCLIQTRSQLQQLIRCSFLCMQIKLSIEQQATSKLTTVFF